MHERGKERIISMGDPIDMKCKKCRTILLTYPETRVESSHGAEAADASVAHCPSDVWYIPEDHIPSWMTSNIDKGQWVKGKVNCPKCGARIGSYNFVAGMKCGCGLQMTAPVHVVKSKVDFFIPSLTHFPSLFSSNTTEGSTPTDSTPMPLEEPCAENAHLD